MSSELDRRLRAARETLPAPDARATERARRRILAAVRRQRSTRIAVLATVALVGAVVLGSTIGSVAAPEVTASRGLVGLGFLPEPGWYVLQSSASASTTRPAVAVASNVPFDPEDDMFGAAESSALPYSTLLRLPQDGIVVTVTFTPRGVEPWHDEHFPQGKLPLRLPDAFPQTATAVQLRPEEPLGVHRTAVAVNDYNLDVLVYFGSSRPSAALLAEAERQLERLVVRGRPSERGPSTQTAPLTAGPTTATLLDRTYSCATRASGGVPEIEARARAGVARRASGWTEMPLVALSTGTDTGSVMNALDNELAWVSAGRPSARATVVPDPYPGVRYPVASWGTVAVNTKLCRASSERVPLTGSTLVGVAASQLGDALDCAATGRVLVRIQAALPSAKVTRFRHFLRTTEPAREARIAVRAEDGWPLVYAEITESGTGRLLTARSCKES